MPNIRPIIAAIAVFAGVCHPVHAQQSDPKLKLQAFIAAAATKLKPSEALDALKNGPPEEYFRWGEGICSELRRGRSYDQLITGNLDQFFDSELSVALVHASRTVICADLSK